MRTHESDSQRITRCIPSRSLALFLGAFSLLNMVGYLLGHSANQNTWWIDFSFLSIVCGRVVGSIATVLLEVLSGPFLCLWAVCPNCKNRRRITTAVLTGLIAASALQNAIAYWMILAQEGLSRALPLSFSLLVALVLTYLVVAIMRNRCESNFRASSLVAYLSGALIIALCFPLFQIVFFGTTDYRREASAVVIFGARVYEDGSLSRALAERMDTGIELYEQGLVPKLIVSGGLEINGVVEAESMRDYAIAAGVPPSAIIMDPDGDNTETSVKNTIRIMDEKDMDTVLVSSSFYHLPRIKMLYLTEHRAVLTVPTIGEVANNGTFKAIWREIPAWWFYWLKNSLLG